MWMWTVDLRPLYVRGLHGGSCQHARSPGFRPSCDSPSGQASESRGDLDPHSQEAAGSLDLGAQSW